MPPPWESWTAARPECPRSFTARDTLQLPREHCSGQDISTCIAEHEGGEVSLSLPTTTTKKTGYDVREDALTGYDLKENYTKVSAIYNYINQYDFFNMVLQSPVG